MLNILVVLLSKAIFFLHIYFFSKKSFRNTTSLDPDRTDVLLRCSKMGHHKTPYTVLN